MAQENLTVGDGEPSEEANRNTGCWTWVTWKENKKKKKEKKKAHWPILILGGTSSPKDLRLHNEAKPVLGTKLSLAQPSDTKTIILSYFDVREALKTFREICGIQETDDRGVSSLSSASFVL